MNFSSRINVFLLALSLLLPSIVTAQRRIPADVFHEELAASKAQRFAGLYAEAPVATANQASYDVLYYELDLTMDPATSVVSGQVTMTAEVLAGPLATAEVDFLDNMTVTGVTGTGGGLTFSHGGDIVTVTLDAAYATGEVFTFTIHYSGTPDPATGAFDFDTENFR